MKNILAILSIVLLSLTSCNQKQGSETVSLKKEIQEPLADFDDLISDYMKWWSYHYYKIVLSSDFKAINENSDKISKGDFLKKLMTGNYIVIEMKSKEISKIYKLFELPENVNKAISSTIKNVSIQDYHFFMMENTKFPDFNISDIEGVAYNNEKLLGKTTVMKTWFIACKPCIEEMPELNEFVKEYSNEDRIQFLSLALDKKPLLLNFLNQTEFRYAVIPEQRELIRDKLKLIAYPTHLVVDDKGYIKKVFGNASEMMSYIKKDISLEQNEKKNLPPPPPPPAKPLEVS